MKSLYVLLCLLLLEALFDPLHLGHSFIFSLIAAFVLLVILLVNAYQEKKPQRKEHHQ